MTAAPREPDGWAQHENDPDPERDYPQGPFAIMSMPMVRRPAPPPPSKLARGVAGATPDDSE